MLLREVTLPASTEATEKTNQKQTQQPQVSYYFQSKTELAELVTKSNQSTKRLVALSDIDKIVNYLRTLEIPAAIVDINGVKCIVSIESTTVVDTLSGELQCIRINEGYLVCRPY